MPDDFEYPVYKTTGYDANGMEIVSVEPRNVDLANGLPETSLAEQWKRIEKSSRLLPNSKGKLRYHDYVAENHGGIEKPEFDINTGAIRLQDTWDLQPLQKYKILPGFIRNYEFGNIVGGKPFRWDQTFLYRNFH